jgi:hypothetical protein
MTNSFATFALLAWPLVALVLYAKRPVVEATIWTILGAQLLLPVGAFIKIEMIPVFDKNSIPSFAALAGCLMSKQRPLRKRQFGLVEILITMLVLGPLVTSVLNGDPIFIGGTLVPAVGIYDAVSASENAFIFLIPFFLGRHFLQGQEDISKIFYALVIAWLAYSLLVIFELRMSPQLHAWIYGYSAALNIEMHEGGYRPRVFMQNGLMLALYGMMSAVAAAAFWRTRERIAGLAASAVTTYLSALLVLGKSFGAILFGAALIPLVRFAKPRFQLNIAVILVTIAMIYPALRIADVFPTNSMVELANIVSAERSRSLEFRFIQEGQLLQHAYDRLLFGWGRYGRSRIVSEDGEDHSITDGHWIITLGQFGIIGFIAEFGLFGWAVFRAASALRFVYSERSQVFLSASALIVAVTLVDQLPNSSITPFALLLAGALLGRSESVRTIRSKQQRDRPAIKKLFVGQVARKVCAD